jgi:hypothetical protein
LPDAPTGAPSVVPRPLTLAAHVALEIQEGGWRPDEIAAEAAVAHLVFQDLDAAGRHASC